MYVSMGQGGRRDPESARDGVRLAGHALDRHIKVSSAVHHSQLTINTHALSGGKVDGSPGVAAEAKRTTTA